MNQQFQILDLHHHWLLNLKHLQLQMMKMKWKVLLQAQNEAIMRRENGLPYGLLTIKNTKLKERVPKWNSEEKKAKWDEFLDQCITEITPDLFNDAEDKMAILSSTLLDIAADDIPKTFPFPKRKAKHWLDEDCQAAKKERNEANKLANKHPSAANSMRARLIQAITKKLLKQKKHDSWKNYVSSMLIRRFGIWYVI